MPWYYMTSMAVPCAAPEASIVGAELILAVALYRLASGGFVVGRAHQVATKATK